MKIIKHIWKLCSSLFLLIITICMGLIIIIFFSFMIGVIIGIPIGIYHIATAELWPGIIVLISIIGLCIEVIAIDTITSIGTKILNEIKKDYNRYKFEKVHKRILQKSLSNLINMKNLNCRLNKNTYIIQFEKYKYRYKMSTTTPFKKANVIISNIEYVDISIKYEIKFRPEIIEELILQTI
jgi:hypothetical protein